MSKLDALIECTKCKTDITTKEQWPVKTGPICQMCWEELCGNRFWMAMNFSDAVRKKIIYILLIVCFIRQEAPDE